MKKFGQFCTAFVLTLVFTLSAFAGDIPFPGSTVQTTSTTSETLTLDTTSDSSTSDVVALDPVTEATLSLLQSVASLF